MRRLLVPIALAASLPAAAQRSIPPAEHAAVLQYEDRREYSPRVFAPLLGHADPGVRRRAALAAGRIRDRTAASALVPLLADQDSGVVATAAFALGLLGDTASAPALIPLLDPASLRLTPTVVAEAATALGRIRGAAARSALERFLGTAPERGAGVREAVGAALLAAWRFPRPADQAPIVRWLSSADTALSWRAAYALSRRPDPVASAALSAHSAHPHSLVRSFVMRALSGPLADSSGVGRPAALAMLVRGVADPDHAVSINALRALGTHPSEEAVALLVRALAHQDAYLAITAAESLGRLGERASSAAEPLAAGAMDEGRPVALRTAALSALLEADRDRASPVADAFARSAEWRLRAAAAGAYADLGAWVRLAELAREADGRVAGAAVGAVVGTLGDSVASQRRLLTDALGHPDVIVRTNALGGFSAMADPSDLPLVLDAYHRARADTLNDAALAAIAAAGAIGKSHPSAARAFFGRFQRPRDYLLRQAAGQAFGDSTARAEWGPALPVDDALTPSAAAEVAVAALPRGARIVTSRGTITLELFSDDAPVTVRSFSSLARRGYFDGQEWPRVVPNFVIQGGDPRGDTSGGPGYAIRDEINRHPYLTGTLGMALSGPDTGGSQWFLTHSPQPHLDGTYTVFGRVVGGMEVVHRVLPGDRIVTIEIIP